MAMSVTATRGASAEDIPARSYGSALMLLATLFFMCGFITVINNTLLPHLKSVFDLNYTQTTLIKSVWFIAYFVVSSRTKRDGEILWERPFLTGERNMSHTLANLKHHHFKYARFWRPGDVPVHFLGTATLSCADGVAIRPGDVFEIEASPFGLPLRNPLAREEAIDVEVQAL